jgi:hypothetical protein
VSVLRRFPTKLHRYYGYVGNYSIAAESLATTDRERCITLSDCVLLSRFVPPTLYPYNLITMPALDRHHSAVRNALIKDGWTITADPLTLYIGEDRIHIDLGAERVIAAEKGTRKIAVEVKTFAGASKLAALEEAVGQYIVYRIALRRIEPDRELYIAAPQPIVGNRFAHRELWKAFLTEENGKVFGYDPDEEEIKQWLP